VTQIGVDAPVSWPVPSERSRELYERAKLVLPGGVNGASRNNTPFPLSLTRAEGALIEDADGNSYVDFHCGFGAVLFGHCDPRVREAAVETLDSGGVTFASSHPLELKLAERIVDAVPSADQAVFACIGTEVTYHAIRLARVHTGRRRVIKFEGNYHGWHDYLYWSVRFSPEAAGPGRNAAPVPGSAGMSPEAGYELLICEYNDSERLEELFTRHGEEIAALIIEPIFHNGGIVMPAPGFLELCRELCTYHGAVLIFDEVITGFRQALGGAQEIFGVTPDLTTLGKAIANGFPIAVLAGRSSVMADLAPLGGAYYSGTFNGHLLNVAVANRCCEILVSDPPYEALNELGSAFKQGVSEAIEQLGVRARFDQFGSVWCLYFTRDEVKNYRDIAALAAGRGGEIQAEYRSFMLSRGFYIHPHTVLRGYLTTAHTIEHIDGAIVATAEFLEAHAQELREEP
jgi:glutamate-1-semialdehyde 2,1-aminomutase